MNRNNANFHRYGGRGIQVCFRWLWFVNFFADMGRKPSKKHSIDRIDNNGDYEPGNCRWATSKQQANNTRRTKRVQVEGQTMTLSEYVERYGVPRSRAERCLELGIPLFPLPGKLVRSPKRRVYLRPDGRPCHKSTYFAIKAKERAKNAA